MSREYVMQLEATIANLERDKQTIKDELFKYRDLEKELGCPLEVIFKALRQGYIYSSVEKDYIIDLKIDEQSFFIAGYKDANVSTRFNVYLDNYKKTWWLKEDKSE